MSVIVRLIIHLTLLLELVQCRAYLANEILSHSFTTKEDVHCFGNNDGCDFRERLCQVFEMLSRHPFIFVCIHEGKTTLIFLNELLVQILHLNTIN